MRMTRDSKPFFFAFATICGVVPGVIGYGVMQITSSRNEQLEAQLRKNARPETLVSIFPLERKQDQREAYVASSLSQDMMNHIGTGEQHTQEKEAVNSIQSIRLPLLPQAPGC